MVAKQPKRGFKTTVSYVSSNVFQKVVTIKNPCSTVNAPPSPPPPPPPPPPSPPDETRQAVHAHDRGVPSSLRDDLCCSVPVPLTIVISNNHNDQDTVTSELSCELQAASANLIQDRPPTPRPDHSIRKTLRKFCLTDTTTPSSACVLHTLPTSATDDANNSMEWPSDEEDIADDGDDNQRNTLASGAERLSKFDSVCGLDFWQGTCNNEQRRQTPTPNSWGLMIADRDDQDEKVAQFQTSKDGMAVESSGSTYEYREPMVTLRDPFYSI